MQLRTRCCQNCPCCSSVAILCCLAKQRGLWWSSHERRLCITVCSLHRSGTHHRRLAARLALLRSGAFVTPLMRCLHCPSSVSPLLARCEPLVGALSESTRSVTTRLYSSVSRCKALPRWYTISSRISPSQHSLVVRQSARACSRAITWRPQSSIYAAEEGKKKSRVHTVCSSTPLA